MAEERPPGPSPAYDQFRQAPGPAQPPGAHPPAAQQPSQPQQHPSPPRRNPDGSWTVDVAPAGPSYPPPREPIAATHGVRFGPPTNPEGAPPPPHGHGPWAEGSPSARRGRRLGLILGIAVPVAVLGVVALVAALVVPGVLRDRDARDAAEAYQQERADWDAVFSDAALQPFAELDTSAFDAALLDVAPIVASGAYGDAAADVAGLQGACDALAAVQPQAALLTAAPPSLRVVDGGDANASYAAAAADLASSQGAFDASTTFAADVAEPLDAIGAACALMLAQASAHADFLVAEQAYRATLTLPTNGTERYDVDASRWIEFTCLSPDGCAPFADRAARAASGDAFDAAYVAYDAVLAQSYGDHCPTASLQPACDAWASMHDESARLAAAVGQAYRDEDVVGGAVSSEDAAPAPDLVAARDAFVAGQQEAYASASQTTSGVAGVPTMPQAIDLLVDASAQTVRDAAAAIVG